MLNISQESRLLNKISETTGNTKSEIQCNCSQCYMARRPYQFLGNTMGPQIGEGIGLMAPLPKIGLAGRLGKFGKLVNESESVWKLNKFLRGRKVEQFLGENLGWNFPVIDKLSNGVATSIKSIDLTAESYQKGNAVFDVLNKYINKIDGFGTTTWAGRTVTEGVDYTSKAIELGIQANKATLNQWEQISKAIQTAKSKGIDVSIKFIQ